MCTLDEQAAALLCNAAPECNAAPKQPHAPLALALQQPNLEGISHLSQLAELLSLPAHLDRPKDEVHVACAQHLLMH